MARSQTMVQLTDELVSRLDKEAGRLGVSRSALIRAAVDEHLRLLTETSVGEQIVAGYHRIPPATPDSWGDLETISGRATRELLTRLDEEERRSGKSW